MGSIDRLDGLGADGGEERGAIERVDGGKAADDGVLAECVPEIGTKEVITDGKYVVENEKPVGLHHHFDVGFTKWTYFMVCGDKPSEAWLSQGVYAIGKTGAVAGL